VREFCAERGYSPSNREIAAGVGCTAAWVSAQLWYMRDKGLVTYEDYVARTVRVL
jgi:hypothetical protein